MSGKSNIESDWNQINSEQDLKNLMNSFGGFHDACLREMHMWTEHYVNSNLSMAVSGDLDCRASVLFQRQFTNPSAIELLFEEVLGIHIVPSPENYDSIIFGATFILSNGIFYWADDEDWEPNDNFDYQRNWISARKVMWRDVSDCMGPELRYGVYRK